MNTNTKKLIGAGLIVLVLVLILQSTRTPKDDVSTETDNISNSITSTPTAESPAFVNTLWNATSIENKEVLAETSITVQFNSEGNVTGFDGCNNFNGSYTINESNLTINQNLISTKIACDENIMNQADTFTKLLLATTSFVLGDGEMALNQNDVSGLTFSGVTNSLSKTTWNVTGYNNGKQAVVSPIIDTNPTMTFGDDGTISGNTGCNDFSGTYSLNLSEGSIAISTLAVTARECISPDGIMEQESSLLTSLQNAKTWSMQGNQLTLRTQEDQIAINAINSLTTKAQ